MELPSFSHFIMDTGGDLEGCLWAAEHQGPLGVLR